MLSACSRAGRPHARPPLPCSAMLQPIRCKSSIRCKSNIAQALLGYEGGLGGLLSNKALVCNVRAYHVRICMEMPLGYRLPFGLKPKVSRRLLPARACPKSPLILPSHPNPFSAITRDDRGPSSSKKALRGGHTAAPPQPCTHPAHADAAPACNRLIRASAG